MPLTEGMSPADRDRHGISCSELIWEGASPEGRHALAAAGRPDAGNGRRGGGPAHRYIRRHQMPVRGIRVHGTRLRCTSLHGFQTAADFYPDFYPNRRHSGIEMTYLLVTATQLASSARLCGQPSKLVMRVRFPSPALLCLPRSQACSGSAP